MRSAGTALSLALLLLTVISTAWARPARADSSQIVTTLHQGWNLVGWVDVETPVDQLFGDEGIPRLESVQAWDSVEQRWLTAAPDGGDLQTLTPGMGLWLRVSPGAPFEWHRVRGRYANSTMLRPGENLVAWSALDAVPAAVGLRQVRDAATMIGAWDAEKQRWRLAVPHAPHSLWTLTQFNHGDAIWIDAADEIEWRQLTGESPRVTFIGDVSDEQRKTTLAEFELIRETFAMKFGGVSSAVDVLVFENGDVKQAWRKRHKGNASTPPCGEAGSGEITYNLECGVSTLAHEYFHELQWRTGDSIRSLSTPYAWLKEGTAELASFLFADSSQPGEFERQIRAAWTAVTTSDQSLSDATSGLIRYTGGAVAAYMLAQRAGTDALLRYLRDLHPVGQERSHSRSASDVFAQTFSISLNDFYHEWEQATESVPVAIRPLEQQATELVSTESPWRLDVEVRGPNGRTVDEVVRVIPGGFAFDGSLSMAARPGSYSLVKAEMADCLLTSWTTGSSAGGAASKLLVSDQWGLPPNQIRVGLGCDSTITGIVLTPNGSALDPSEFRVWIRAYTEPLPPDGWPAPQADAIPGPDGRFEMSVPSGRYSVGVGPVEAGLPGFGWHVPNGLSLRRGDRHVVDAPRNGAAEIEVTLPFGRQVTVAGTVYGPTGQPLHGVDVRPFGPAPSNWDDPPGWVGWGESTTTSGFFDVPFRGEHVRLKIVKSDGQCSIGTFGPNGFTAGGQGEAGDYFDVNDEDITSLEIRLPSLECS